MGKPRMIILIRHAQSEGNKNRDIHQYIPDHRVKLTPEGWSQAEEAGRRLRSLLKPDDTLQFYTSPYRRTRETTEGILRTLTSDDPDQGPSPFPRHKVKVYEEPRIREQDFGNFQPCSAEMERMWQERADYGHFFYRIPNGESAADAYDRVSGFNESLWRQFGETDFPSVCVVVTHGLMTRIFLMKWYHWSVEYFEDLRNINHCEFIIMKQNTDNGKYILQNQLRTWSDLKRRAALANDNKPSTPTTSTYSTRRWGGCAQGCNHGKFDFHRRPRRQNTQDFIQQPPSDPASASNEGDDHPIAAQEADKAAAATGINDTAALKRKGTTGGKSVANGDKGNGADGDSTEAQPLETATAAALVSPATTGTLTTEETSDGADDTPAEGSSSSSEAEELEGASSISLEHLHLKPQIPHKASPSPSATLLLNLGGRDFGGSRSGVSSPNEVSDDSDYFDTNIHQLASRMSIASSVTTAIPRSKLSRGLLAQIEDGEPSSSSSSSKTTANGDRRASSKPRASVRPSSRNRKTNNGGGCKRSMSSRTKQEWVEESGMTGAKKADALGDMTEENDGDNEEGDGDGDEGRLVDLMEDEVDGMKERDRKGFGEIY